jgi:hypothetical protein
MQCAMRFQNHLSIWWFFTSYMIYKRCCWGVKPRDTVSGAWKVNSLYNKCSFGWDGQLLKSCVCLCMLPSSPRPNFTHNFQIMKLSSRHWPCLDIHHICLWSIWGFNLTCHENHHLDWGLTTVTLSYNLCPCRSKCIYKNHTHLHSSTVVWPHFICVKISSELHYCQPTHFQAVVSCWFCFCPWNSYKQCCTSPSFSSAISYFKHCF